MAADKKMVPFMLERRFEDVLSTAARMEARTVSGYIRHRLELDWRRKRLIDDLGNILVREEDGSGAGESRSNLAEVS